MLARRFVPPLAQARDLFAVPQQAPGDAGTHMLHDRVALITGSDSGIGRALALLYAREGADVAIVGLGAHDDAEETKRLVEAEGRRCLLLPGDAKDGTFCEDAIARTVKEFGRLDVVVKHAGQGA